MKHSIASTRRSRSSLAILERAYRGSLEEQYGHIVWLSRVMKRMGATHGLLLKGDCVLFARRGQPRISLDLGGVTLEDISDLESGVAALIDEQVPVYAWRSDLCRLGLTTVDLVGGVTPVDHQDMPAIIHRFDSIWYW